MQKFQRKKKVKPTEITQLKSKDIQRIRDEILAEQNGLCYLCGKPPIRPCLDHFHVKRIKGDGKIRGVLCSSCNVFVAKVENNCVRYAIGISDLPKILTKMVKYFQKDRYNLIHPSEAEKPKKLTKSSYKKLAKIWKVPPYPKSGKLTKELEKCFEEAGIEPEFYK